MAYWIKSAEIGDYTYSEDGDKLKYNLTAYEGPFRTIGDVEDFLKGYDVYGAEVIRFG
jgi:hypothetical protein